MTTRLERLGTGTALTRRSSAYTLSSRAGSESAQRMVIVFDTALARQEDTLAVMEAEVEAIVGEVAMVLAGVPGHLTDPMAQAIRTLRATCHEAHAACVAAAGPHLD